MSFSRTTPKLLTGPTLHEAMRSIGLRIGPLVVSSEPADLEVTLASAVMSALPRDYRRLGVIVAWLEVHHSRVNVPRLGRVIAQPDLSALARCFWSAVGVWLGRTDARFRPLARLYRGARLSLDDAEITAVQMKRVGADPRFEGTPLLVHARLLRSRTADVDDAVQLAARHSVYLRRVQLGANYRADVWAALDRNPTASPAEIARRVGCAYETARSVGEDWKTVRLATAAA